VIGRVKVEICLGCNQNLEAEVDAAYQGGASTIELCSEMRHDGLTPLPEHIAIARQAFEDRCGLMVMIRPRPGDFRYSRDELREMTEQVKVAAEKGANGVVFGVLDGQQNIDMRSLEPLVKTSQDLNLMSTFHRAFDATSNSDESLDRLIDLEIDRVLTSGVPWGKTGTALDGLDRLQCTIEHAAGRIETVICGGISAANATPILDSLSTGLENVSIHAYSGAKEDGITTVTAVQALVNAAGATS